MRLLHSTNRRMKSRTSGRRQPDKQIPVGSWDRQYSRNFSDSLKGFLPWEQQSGRLPGEEGVCSEKVVVLALCPLGRTVAMGDQDGAGTDARF